MKILEAKDISFGYDKKEVLKNINLSVEEADFMGYYRPQRIG